MGTDGIYKKTHPLKPAAAPDENTQEEWGAESYLPWEASQLTADDIKLEHLKAWHFNKCVDKNIARLIEEELKNPISECSIILNFDNDTYGNLDDRITVKHTDRLFTSVCMILTKIGEVVSHLSRVCIEKVSGGRR